MISDETEFFSWKTTMRMFNLITTIIIALLFEILLFPKQSVHASHFGNNAECAWMALPGGGRPIIEGRTYWGQIAMRNNGTTTWTSNVYKLGSQDPQDNTRWGFGRIYLSNSPVYPGQIGYFNFTVTPTSRQPGIGTFYFNWQMVHEGVEWFGNKCSALITVQTSSSAWNEAACTVGSNLVEGGTGCSDLYGRTTGSVYTSHLGFRKKEVATNESIGVLVEFENSGRTTWVGFQDCDPGPAYLECGYRLGLRGAYDWGWGGRVPVSGRVKPTAEVGPDPNIARFSGNIRAPSAPGTYNFSWQMVQENRQWFGPIINFPVRVFGQSRIYVNPSSSRMGDRVTVTATSDYSCSTNNPVEGGAGLGNCVETARTCPGSNPTGDGNPCYFRIECTAIREGTFTAQYSAASGATFPERNPSCAASTTYRVDRAIQPLTVTCSGSPNPANIGQTVTWAATVRNGSIPYTYSWTGTDSLSGNSSSVSKSYSSSGTKNATVTVRSSDGQVASSSCSVAVYYPVSGYIRNSSTGAGIPNAQVRVFDGTRGVNIDVTTDASGRFTANIPYGNSYAVRLLAAPAGYQLPAKTTTTSYTWRHCGINSDTPLGSPSYECQVSGGNDCSGPDATGTRGRCNFVYDPNPTGFITVNPSTCTIAWGKSSCSPVTVQWDSDYAGGSNSKVRRNNPDGSVDWFWSDANGGGIRTLGDITQGETTFTLISENGIELATASITANLAPSPTPKSFLQTSGGDVHINR